MKEMIMYLAFDTETTDLPRADRDLAHYTQPHLLQFAGVVFDDQGREVDRLITLVKPRPGTMLSPAAYRAHGISLELASSGGMEALDVFNWFTRNAASVSQVIAHNVLFDIQVMTILGLRVTGQLWTPPCPLFCTMVHSAPIVKLPPTAKMKAPGRYQPKPPTLSECIDHFFGEELVGAHDAATDVGACIRVFRHLTLERGLAA
jgi:DNA polymerase-3 subunit epsilon